MKISIHIDCDNGLRYQSDIDEVSEEDYKKLVLLEDFPTSDTLNIMCDGSPRYFNPSKIVSIWVEKDACLE